MATGTDTPGHSEKGSNPANELSLDRSASTISSKEEDNDSLPSSPVEGDDVDLENARTHSLSRVATTPATQENMLARTLSMVRTKDSGRDPGPPPDGGVDAWTQVFLAHLVIFNTWGYINGFGVFQTYYTELLDRSPSDISWIGSIQIFLLFFIGTFSGRATDAGYFKAVWSVGAVIIMFAIFMASLCKTYWQLFMAQGLCMGIGAGLIFCPTLTLVPTYFTSHRAVALAIAACGSATGGMIFPVVVQRLLPVVGFAWTMRVLGLISVVTLAPGFVLFRQRLPPRKSGPFFELAAFKEAPYSLYAIGMYLTFWGLYIAFFYVGSFGREVIGLNQEESINLIIIMNGLGTIGRVVPSFISDWKTGPFNALIPCTFITAVVAFGWIGVQNVRDLYVFSSFYGFFAAGIQALFPAGSSSLTTDLKKTGIRFGMLLSIVSFASLTGSPIAGALIQARNGDYLYAQIFCALCMTVGTGTLMMARYKVAGPALRVRV